MRRVRVAATRLASDWFRRLGSLVILSGRAGGHPQPHGEVLRLVPRREAAGHRELRRHHGRVGVQRRRL